MIVSCFSLGEPYIVTDGDKKLITHFLSLISVSIAMPTSDSCRISVIESHGGIKINNVPEE